MRKIGIITHYYKSLNYGGNLQAYALCKVLDKESFDAQQISYDFSDSIQLKEIKKLNFPQRIKRTINWYVSKINRYLKHKKFNKKVGNEREILERRKGAFFNFNQSLIPHSSDVFDSKNVEKCIDDYDCFITGSDQVWNLNYYLPAFFLDFVPSSKVKMSYAASVSMSSFNDFQMKTVKNNLKDFTAISVREDSAVDLIKDLSLVPVEQTLDPTLLLTAKEWDEVAVDYPVDENYVFCYFLGYNAQARKLAKKFAKKNNLKLINIVCASGYFTYEDYVFGKEQTVEVGPEQFISLIKNAKYVFTDSFHAVVFSSIYKKQFFVFKRSKTAEMSERITSVTKLFNTEDRFCFGERENIKYVEGLDDIIYPEKNQKLEELKQKSLEFLRINLGKQ